MNQRTAGIALSYATLGVQVVVMLGVHALCSAHTGAGGIRAVSACPVRHCVARYAFAGL